MAQDSFSVQSKGGEIFIAGAVKISECHRLLAAVHDRVDVKGYENISLDFSECTHAFPGPMNAVTSQIMALRAKAIQVDLTLPTDPQLARLFHNANWAHLIAPEMYDPSRFRGRSQVPATQFESLAEQRVL